MSVVSKLRAAGMASADTPIHLMPVSTITEGCMQDDTHGLNPDDGWLRVKATYCDYLFAWCELAPPVHSISFSSASLGNTHTRSAQYYYAPSGGTKGALKILAVVRYKNTVRAYTPALRLYPVAWTAMLEDMNHE